MAQPSDLPSKPGTESRRKKEESELAQAQENLSQQPPVDMDQVDVEATAESLIPGQPLGTSETDALIADQEASEADYKDLDDNELYNQGVQNTLGYFEEVDREPQSAADIELDPTIDQQGRPIGFWTEVGARAAASFSMKPEQKQRIMQRMLGEDFRVFRDQKSNRLKMQKKGSKNSFFVDEEGFEGPWTEVIQDVFSDNADLIADLVASLTTEAGMVSAGAAGGTAAGGFPIGTAGGAAAGFAAGIPASAYAATKMRQEALEALGETMTDEEFNSELKTNMAYNAVGLGAGMVAVKTFKRIGSIFKKASESSTGNVVENLAEVRQSWEQVKSQFNHIDITTKGDAGRRVEDAAAALDRQLGDDLGLSRDSLKLQLGGERIVMPDYPKALHEVLTQELRVAKERIPMLVSEGEMGDAARKALYESLEESRLMGNGNAAANLAEDALESLRKINKNGGMTVDELADDLKFWKGSAAISKRTGKMADRPDGFERLARKLRKSLSNDEINASIEAFKDVPAKSAELKMVKQRYSTAQEGLKFIRDTFKNKKSAEKAIDAFVAPGKADEVKTLKRFLGADSDEFGLIRQSWMEKLHQNVLDSKGIPIPGAIEKQLTKYGDDVVNEFLDSRQVKALKLISKRSESIPGLRMASAEDEQFIRDSAAVIILNYHQPGIIIRGLYHMTKTNEKAAKYLAHDGLLQFAKEVKNPAKKDLITKVKHGLTNLYDGLSRIDVKDPNAKDLKRTILRDFSDELEMDKIKIRSDRELKGLSRGARESEIGKRVARDEAPAGKIKLDSSPKAREREMLRAGQLEKPDVRNPIGLMTTTRTAKDKLDEGKSGSRPIIEEDDSEPRPIIEEN